MLMPKAHEIPERKYNILSSESTYVSQRSTSWDRDYWRPEPLWQGRTVFILAGGPSLREIDPDILKGQTLLVINASCMLAPWAGLLLFMDQGWAMAHQREIAEWKGLAVSTSITAKRMMPRKVNRIQVVLKDNFQDVPEGYVRMGASGGHVAISLAIAMGAKTLVLLGYDMKLAKDGKSHFHNEYLRHNDDIYVNKFIPGFRGWNQQAKEVGVDIFNTSSDSALDEFPRASLMRFLPPIKEERR